MNLNAIDSVIQIADDRIVAVKRITDADEYLRDHFPTFPVLPGVMMLEAMTESARRLLTRRDPDHARLVLGRVRAVKFGAMVRPGHTLRIEVMLLGDGEADDSGAYTLRGIGHVLEADVDPAPAPDASARAAVFGRFSMRPVRFGREARLADAPVNTARTGDAGRLP